MKYCPNPECPYRKSVGHAAEYVDEATECSDCETALVSTPPEFARPPGMGWDEMVPVMHVSDPALLPVVESLLKGAGIAHYIHGSNVQDLFGVGRMGTGFNVVAGQPTLFVDSSRVEEARQLLQEVAPAPDSGKDRTD